ncbi:MAG: glycosyltransferase family 61 protein [Muribaculaceae bacterium]|nr:glycosyltransferase family 61 protein [Muribaculaceae bacterium]
MSCVVYSDKKYEKYFRSHIERQTIVPTKIHTVKRGIVAARGAGCFGVFDSDGNLVDASRQIRGTGHQIIPDIDICADIDFVDSDVIFLGSMNPEFGHFLLERMCRAYALCDPAYRGMRVVLVNTRGMDKMPNWVYDMLGALGIAKQDVLLIDHDTQFRSVVVPEQAFNIASMAGERFTETFEIMARNTPDIESSDKIYVSRSALKSRRTYGEVVVQNIFAKNGFQIVYPETLPLAEQIGIMKNCRVLAGCAGTALHMALFMPRGGTVIQIKRNCKKRDNAPTQHLINRVMGASGYFYICVNRTCANRSWYICTTNYRRHKVYS